MACPAAIFSQPIHPIHFIFIQPIHTCQITSKCCHWMTVLTLTAATLLSLFTGIPQPPVPHSSMATGQPRSQIKPLPPAIEAAEANALKARAETLRALVVEHIELIGKAEKCRVSLELCDFMCHHNWTTILPLSLTTAGKLRNKTRVLEFEVETSGERCLELCLQELSDCTLYCSAYRSINNRDRGPIPQPLMEPAMAASNTLDAAKRRQLPAWIREGTGKYRFLLGTLGSAQ